MPEPFVTSSPRLPLSRHLWLALFMFQLRLIQDVMYGPHSNMFQRIPYLIRLIVNPLQTSQPARRPCSLQKETTSRGIHSMCRRHNCACRAERRTERRILLWQGGLAFKTDYGLTVRCVVPSRMPKPAADCCARRRVVLHELQEEPRSTGGCVSGEADPNQRQKQQQGLWFRRAMNMWKYVLCHSSLTYIQRV